MIFTADLNRILNTLPAKFIEVNRQCLTGAESAFFAQIPLPCNLNTRSLGNDQIFM